MKENDVQKVYWAAYEDGEVMESDDGILLISFDKETVEHYPSLPNQVLQVMICRPTASRPVVVGVAALKQEDLNNPYTDRSDNICYWSGWNDCIDDLLKRNFLAGAPVGGDERPAIPGLQEAIERREKLLATKRTLGHENRGIHTEGDPIFEAAKLYASCQSGVPDGWQLIETAPRDGTTVLLFSNKNGLGWNITGYGRWEGGDDIVSGWVSFGMIEPGGNLGLANPTHWMPLPAAPRDGRD